MIISGSTKLSLYKIRIDNLIKLILNSRGFVVVQENGERFSQTHKHFKLSTSDPASTGLE